MYSEKITPKTNEIVINIPKSYIDKELYIKITPGKKIKNFNKYFGVMQTENIEDEIKRIRNEWERLE
jgi:hypothetical protein